MACDRCNYFSFWAILSHFIPLKAPKIQNSNKMKKKKNYLEISSVPKIMIICFIVPEIRHVTDVIIFHFGLFFAFLPL